MCRLKYLTSVTAPTIMVSISIGLLCIALFPLAPARSQDKNSPVKSLQMYRCGDNIRSIVTTDDGFIAGTDTGVVRYAYVDGKPIFQRRYTADDGLAFDRCYCLQADANGGIWAGCYGGVGYLAPGAEKWESFSGKNHLSVDTKETFLTLSAKKDRVWVITADGLSTVKISELNKWETYPKPNLAGLSIHPASDIVWCSVVSKSSCFCGWQVTLSEFDLSTEKWRDIPDISNCGIIPVNTISFSTSIGWTWILNGCDPPKIYDKTSSKTIAWTKELIPDEIDGNEKRFRACFEYFADAAPAKDNDGNMWFSVPDGLWQYIASNDKWKLISYKTPQRSSGPSRLAINAKGDKIAWARQDALAVYNTTDAKWTACWERSEKITPPEDENTPSCLTFSPDEKYLWCLGNNRVMIGDLSAGTIIAIADKDAPGLSQARQVVFDQKRSLALIATPRGIVCADYSGKIIANLRRGGFSAVRPVERFVFAPDGSEVWCISGATSVLRGPGRGRAAILDASGNWSEFPDPTTQRCLHDVIFSADSKTCWVSLSSDDESELGVLQRAGKNQNDYAQPDWLKNLHSYAGNFWLSPNGHELWMDERGRGLLRLKLKTGDLSRYVKSESYRLEEGLKECGSLIADYAKNMTFTSDSKYAICSARGGQDSGVTLIDLASGKSTDLPSADDNANLGDVEDMALTPDNKTVWCLFSKNVLRSLNIAEGKWSNDLTTNSKFSPSSVSSLTISPDGKYLWLAGYDGFAVYSIANKSWKTFNDAAWRQDSRPTLCISDDGDYVICGHSSGIALIGIDGNTQEILSPGHDISQCQTSHIRPLGKSGNFVCAINHPRAGGIYLIDMKAKQLRKIKELGQLPVSALDVGPKGQIFASVDDGVLIITLP